MSPESHGKTASSASGQPVGNADSRSSTSIALPAPWNLDITDAEWFVFAYLTAVYVWAFAHLQPTPPWTVAVGGAGWVCALGLLAWAGRPRRGRVVVAWRAGVDAWREAA